MLITCRMIHDIREGRVPGIRAQTYFRLGPGEIAFVSGPCRVLEMRAQGDGSYNTSTFIAGGTGTFGLAMLAGSIGGSAIGNARARSRAAADAQVTWRHQFDATVYVTNLGFTFQNSEGVFGWTHDSIEAMQMVGPHDVLMQGIADKGKITWRLMTPWAELLMVLWGLESHPNHPQLMDGSWLTAGWLGHARSQGYDPGLRSAILTDQPSQIRLPGQGQIEG